MTCQCFWFSELIGVDAFDFSERKSDYQWTVSTQICSFTSIGIPIIKIRWSHTRFIFTMAILIPGKTVFILRQGRDSHMSDYMKTSRHRKASSINWPLYFNLKSLWNSSIWEIRKTGVCLSQTHLYLKFYHMSIMASQITNSTVCSVVCLGIYQRKQQSLCYWPFVRGIHQWLVDSPHKGPVTRKESQCHDVIML